MPRYSATLMDHLESPRNSGKLDNADLVGEANVGGRAPYMTLYLCVDDSRVAAARFSTFGCGAAIAAGSVMTELIINQSIQRCLALSTGEIIDALGGLPANKRFCARLAIGALQDALGKMKH